MHARKLLLLTTIAVAATPFTAAVARAAPILSASQSCYTVGESVGIAGLGFASIQAYEVDINSQFFGISTTDALGSFSASLRPGGLRANVVQSIDTLTASDGMNTSKTTFTVTRAAGARILAGTGKAATLRAPFQIWGFQHMPNPAPLNTGPPLQYPVPVPSVPVPTRRRVYVHYLGPHKRLKMTIKLGRVGGQCGYLRTGPRRVFPFVPSRGTWTLQVDSKRHYVRHPAGPVTRIRVRVT